MQTRTKPTYKPFMPAPNSACLCGSGARFQNCCKSRLPGSNIGKKWRRAAEQKRWADTVRHLRADVTQYTLWHLSHTAPAVAAKPELRAGGLMKIDIEALSERVGSLMWGYSRRGWRDRLPDVLDRLANNIDDTRWHAKIAYHRGIYALWCNDRERASREIAALQPITPKHDDVDLLQIHLDLHGDNMGMMERLSFFDRIRTVTTSNSDKLQYGGARAFSILLSGDEDGARRAFDELVMLGRELEAEKPLSATAETWLCRALEGAAMFARDAELFAEIDERLTRQLENTDTWTAAGRANVLSMLGDSRRYGGAFTEAIKAYREASELSGAPELRTFEAECELRRGNPDEAFRLIRSVSVPNLAPPERADHAFISFYIALARGDRSSLRDARELLKAAKTPQPYFETRRLQYILTIGEALEALDSDKALPDLSPIMAGLKRVSRYVMLQPNWNGIGINGNLIIEDIIDQTRERAKRDTDEIPTYPTDRDQG